MDGTTDDGRRDDGQRLDIWLYRARFFKTRGLAAKMVSKGKVRVTRNGKTDRIKKPHTLIRPGHEAIFMRGTELIHVKMLQAATRRGPAVEAAALYQFVGSSPVNGKTPG